MLSPFPIPMGFALVALKSCSAGKGEYVVPAGLLMTECRIWRGLLVGVEVISVCVIFCIGVVDTDLFFSISRNDVHGFATKKRRLSLLKGKRVEMMRQMGKLTGRDLRSKRGEGSRGIVRFVIATRDEYRKQRIEKNNETRKFVSWFDCPLFSHSVHATHLSFSVVWSYVIFKVVSEVSILSFFSFPWICEFLCTRCIWSHCTSFRHSYSSGSSSAWEINASIMNCISTFSLPQES